MNMNNTIVLFNRPLWLVCEDGDIRTLFETYGFIINSDVKDIDIDELEDYLDYLCGATMWEQQGNSIVKWEWVSNSDSGRYFDKEPYIQKYSKEARQQMHLTYLLFQSNKFLDKNTHGVFDEKFIISRELYNNIMEYGIIVK